MLSLLFFSSLLPAGALAASAYAPSYAACPSPGTQLVRSADGISSAEAEYIAARKVHADAALTSWLAGALPALALETLATSSFPTIALANSGGGFRALLVGAGVVQALDGRDKGGSNTSTKGLYQALTYHAGLSGGAWLLSALAAGDWPTVSELAGTVWETQFAAGILDSSNETTVEDFEQIAEDIATKGALGFPVSLTDAWGRVLSYQIMEGGQGASDVTLSDVASLSKFTSHSVPFPLMTASKITYSTGECAPSPQEAIFEFNPYEFGSWSDDISAFVQTEYIGSNLTAGSPASDDECVTGFDNIDWVLGVSSNILEEFLCDPSLGVDVLAYFPDAIVEVVEEFTPADEYGYSLLPNPFRGFNSTTATAASSVYDADLLYMVDGGEPDRNVPILPLLEPSRNVSVILVNDNGADENSYPEGDSLVAAWNATQTGRLAGRFPRVPAAGDIDGKRAQFFGCDEPAAVTVVYLPNADWTYASNTSTLQLTYPVDETEAMIANGNQVASQGGDAEWAACLACGLVLKEVGRAKLPLKCAACLKEYCWYA